MYFELTTILLITLTSLTRSMAYFITVDAHAEECFFDNVEAGTKMGKKPKTNYIYFKSHVKIQVMTIVSVLFLFCSTNF